MYLPSSCVVACFFSSHLTAYYYAMIALHYVISVLNSDGRFEYLAMSSCIRTYVHVTQSLDARYTLNRDLVGYSW